MSIGLNIKQTAYYSIFALICKFFFAYLVFTQKKALFNYFNTNLLEKRRHNYKFTEKSVISQIK